MSTLMDDEIRRWTARRKSALVAVPAGRGREAIETIRQGLKDDGYAVSINQLCRWFGVPRRTVYYEPTKKPPTVQARLATPIKQMLEEQPRSAIARWLIC